MSSIPVFTGPYYQRGHGLGAALGILKSAVPFLKPLLKNVGRSALSAGAKIAEDVMSGKKVGASIKTHARSELRKGLKRGIDSIRGQSGGGVKRRRRRRVVRKKKPIKRRRRRKRVTSKSTAKRKRRISDIFD